MARWLRTWRPGVQSLSFAPAETSIAPPTTLVSDIGYYRVLLMFTNADDPSYLVIGGYIDVVIVRPNDPDLDDALSLSLNMIDYPEQGQAYADFVADSDALKRTLAHALADPAPDLMFLVLNVFIDPCFRHPDFGLLLIGSLYAFGCQLAEANGLKAPVFVGRIGSDTPDAVVKHWATRMDATVTDDGLMVLPDNASLPRLEHIVAKSDRAGYIKVDAADLRARLDAEDETLTPMTDGRYAAGDSLEETELALTTIQAAAAGRVALDAGNYDEGVVTEVVAAVRFGCTSDSEDGPGELFARAADYLIDNPDVSVVSTSWREGECSEHGLHFTLELIVRPNE
ncbi:hypothetical protein [Mycolicibacterium sp. CBMA 226]|uniref:hypothetical protein n=1 Tax=Mycolicibacterium sp. CBMA 226 TaxID=2606611 RepID=UPI0012DD64BD|nr:hypothetical protein [Mycolicibacterium sp. CBMA 226]MUL78817.1 hypothetical protein [Mycolicibacterium sp. CBMA 226]QGW61112.1 hypothetical protein ICEMyc226_00080 [Mycolicibacterium sp.]